jgi:hypothetical protein
MKTALTFVGALMLLISAPTQSASAFDPQAVQQFKKSISQQMCKDGGEWLRCYKLEPFNCRDVTDAIVNGCVDSVLAGIKSLERRKFIQWMSSDVEACIKKTFADQYGSRKVTSPACGS